MVKKNIQCMSICCKRFQGQSCVWKSEGVHVIILSLGPSIFQFSLFFSCRLHFALGFLCILPCIAENPPWIEGEWREGNTAQSSDPVAVLLLSMTVGSVIHSPFQRSQPQSSPAIPATVQYSDPSHSPVTSSAHKNHLILTLILFNKPYQCYLVTWTVTQIVPQNFKIKIFINTYCGFMCIYTWHYRTYLKLIMASLNVC